MTYFEQKGLFEALEGGAYKARNAIVTGDVTLGEDVGIWFGCVVRGDDAPLTIGKRTNIQDLTMIHADPGVPNVIGDEVIVGHRCVLHGASVGNGALIDFHSAIYLGNLDRATKLLDDDPDLIHAAPDIYSGVPIGVPDCKPNQKLARAIESVERDLVEIGRLGRELAQRDDGIVLGQRPLILAAYHAAPAPSSVPLVPIPGIFSSVAPVPPWRAFS